MPKDISALGKSGARFEGLETFPAPALDVVTMSSDEVTAVCPVTGQPDLYVVQIRYQPDAFCIESKSMKLYLQEFRQKGVFCEQLAVDICNEVVHAIQPVTCHVSVTQKPRGGITIVAEKMYVRS